MIVSRCMACGTIEWTHDDDRRGAVMAVDGETVATNEAHGSIVAPPWSAPEIADEVRIR